MSINRKLRRARERNLAKRKMKIASKQSVATKYLDAMQANVDLYEIHREERSHLTFAGLQKANEHAIATKRNRSLHEWVIDGQDRKHVFPIMQSFVHNNREIRMLLILWDSRNDKAELAMIDVDFEVFDEIEVRDSNSEEAA